MTTILGKSLTTFCCLALFAFAATANGQESEFKQIEIDSLDGLKITADLYMKSSDKAQPFIVLCHQAGWSRGEYREIAPKLNAIQLHGD